MEIDFDGLDWSQMMADTYNMLPKQDPREKFPEVFSFTEYWADTQDIDVKKVLRYIPLVYDKNSQLHKHYTDLYKLKIKAAELAGFIRQEDGRFLSNVEAVMTCSNEIVNKMIIRYVTQHKNALYVRFVMYNELYFTEMEAMLAGRRNGKVSDFDSLGDKLDSIRQQLFANDKSPQLSQDLQKFYFEEKLLLKPEDIAKKLQLLKPGESPVPVPEKKKPQEVEKKILKSYQKEDKWVTLNEDPSLHPIWIPLPECPDIEQVDGYGLPIEEQYWRAPETPSKLKYLINQSEKVDEVWAALESNQSEYRKEIRWIQTQIYHSLFGYWFFNNGKPTYLCGWHYDYLTHWRFAGDIKPEYRDRDRKWYHGVYYAYTTTECPAKDNHGKLIYTDKQKKILKMVDVKRKTFLGYIGPKGRRAGDSNKFLCAEYMETQRHKGKNSGIISSSGDHAKKKLFDEILVPGWQQMPFFYKPVTSANENPDKEIKFIGARKKADSAKVSDQLKSKIDYSSTSESTQYDGGKQFFLDVDEAGKCFGKGTLIRMYDGSIKKVEDIVNGEFVMGNDSTPRKVYGVTSGVEEMFSIMPNKGDEWLCNRSHILSLKVSDRYYINKKLQPLGTIVNISVEDYLKLNKWEKRSLTLYRSGWDYKKRNNHIIDPYMLGVWLGDGNSIDFSITTIDKQIIDTIHETAAKNQLKVKINNRITYHISSGEAKKNPLTKELRRMNLVKNKHIPKEYLIDSRKNRLKLLAGIIDTDGHVEKSKTTKGTHKSIEITQKNEKLANDIYELATSLGFYVKKSVKLATMRRADKSLYMSLVVRLTIYGDIDLIPTKIPYKKAVVSRTKNRKDPQKTGFKIESKGYGEYFGFAVDGNSLFLLADGTVVHNTKDTDVYERHQQLKECVSQGAGINIIGFMGYPSTVGEMEGAGGKQYAKLCRDSFFEKRSESGQTTTGLMLIYISCLEGLEGFVDRYGNSVIDEPTPEQAKFIGKNFGARKHIQSMRKSYLDNGDIEGYNEYVRLFPIFYKECFRTADGDIGFNTVIINERLDELAVTQKDVWRVGNFEWKDGKKYQDRVVWKDDPKGRWRLSQLLHETLTNRYTFGYINGTLQKIPIAPKHTTTTDPFKQGKVNGSRMSDGGIATVYDFDPEVDSRDMDPRLWKSYRIVCTYRNRPATTNDYYEDALMQIVYFGSWWYPEMNIPNCVEWAFERGFGGYFLYDIDWKTGKFKNVPGFNSQTIVKQDLFNVTRDYIETRGHADCHSDWLTECKDIQDMNEMTDYDLFTAGAGALLGCKSKMPEQARKSTEEVKKPNIYKKKSYQT